LLKFQGKLGGKTFLGFSHIFFFFLVRCCCVINVCPANVFLVFTLFYYYIFLLVFFMIMPGFFSGWFILHTQKCHLINFTTVLCCRFGPKNRQRNRRWDMAITRPLQHVVSINIKKGGHAHTCGRLALLNPCVCMYLFHLHSISFYSIIWLCPSAPFSPFVTHMSFLHFFFFWAYSC